MSGQRLIIHQFHCNVALGDAITQQMFFIRESLHRAGIDGEIFATQGKAMPAGKVHAFSRAQMWNADLLLVHHSSGQVNIDQVRHLEVPKALVYHNITPAEFFRHDAFIAGLCHLGRSQLRDWRSHVVTAFADSKFNADELTALGFDPPEILPLMDLKTRISGSQAASRVPGTLLFVGRFGCHKNQEALIAALFYLRNGTSHPYRLILAGSGDPIYRDYLGLLAKQLGVDSAVEFVGKVSPGTLASLYRRADAYVSTSLHEGFGVPLIEAMRYEVPVFALPRAAVGETLGTAGVRLSSDRPSEIAALLHAALGAADWGQSRLRLIEDQNRRLQELAPEQSSEVIAPRLRRWVEQLRLGPRTTAPSPQPSL